MNPPEPQPKPNFDAEFQAALDAWRDKRGVEEDDAVLLCLELFRIHQDHWDRLRRKELPSFDNFRDTVLKLTETAAFLQRHSATLLEHLTKRPEASQWAPPSITAILLAIGAALGAGILIGRLLL